MRHPLIVVSLVGALLFALLYPATHMKVGVPEASVLPKEYESRVGDDILKKDFDYASLTPIEIVATLPNDPLSAEGLSKVKELGERVEATEDIEGVESIYTVGAKAAREYAERLTETREEAESEAAKRIDGTVEEQARAEAQKRAAEELDGQIPELPEGVSADGSVTPEGVANFLAPRRPGGPRSWRVP